MTFDDVENARKAYIEKYNKIRNKVSFVAFGIAALFFLIVTISNFNVIRTLFDTDWRFIAYTAPLALFPFMIVIALPMALTFIVARYKTSQELLNYKKAYKAYFIEQQLSRFFTDLKYSHDAGLNENILSSTGLIYTGDVYQSNDLVSGKYKNVDFMQADVTVQDKHEDSDGNTTYVTVFKGRYMVFEFPKKFDFQLIAVPGKFYNRTRLKNGRKFKKIELESNDFNKRFSVYAEDGFEAFYILDPAFMKSVEELAEKYNNKFALYFTNNKLFVGINNGNDSFEPPNPKQPIDEKAELEKVTSDIKVITDFVDNLRLNH